MDNDGMDGWDVEVPKKEKIDDFRDNNDFAMSFILSQVFSKFPTLFFVSSKT